MARPKKDAGVVDGHDGEAPAGTGSKLVKITAFKIYTTRGRVLADDEIDLPSDEADALIAAGDAVEC
ncbi:MAG: hypothetical protein ACRCS9_00730 [Hyphomicrobium sp.]